MRGSKDPRRLPVREEIERVVEALHGPLQPFALTAMGSGLRLFEVAALEPRDVELGADGETLLHVRHGKGDRERWSVLLEPWLGSFRRALAERAGCARVFSNARGNAWDRKSLEKHWTPARRAVGMEVSDSTNFHFLTRHWHATYLLDIGKSDMDVAVQLGHLTRDGRPNTDLVRRVYGHPDLRRALGRIAA